MVKEKQAENRRSAKANYESISLSEIEGLMLDKLYVSFPYIAQSEPVECG